MLAVLLLPILSIKGVLIDNDIANMSTFKCLKDNGFDFVTVIANFESGKIMPFTVNYLKTAKAAGLNTDILFIPCRGLGAKQQITELLK